MDLAKYFTKSELIPAIVIDDGDGAVLMLAYMNEESLRRTLETGTTWFWSRSRREYWNKGATSGHWQHVVSVAPDCDDDTLLVRVRQEGAACHTGNRSCFYKESLLGETRPEGRAAPAVQGLGPYRKEGASMPEENVLVTLRRVVHDRRENPQEGSYTCYLFEKGLDKILKKCGEECAETIIAAKNESTEDLANEICDLLYHLTVLMEVRGVPAERVLEILQERSAKIGNLKQFRQTDRES